VLIDTENGKNKNGDTAFSALDITAICCKSVITILYFCRFWCVNLSLTGVMNIFVFILYFSATLVATYRIMSVAKRTSDLASGKQQQCLEK